MNNWEIEVGGLTLTDGSGPLKLVEFEPGIIEFRTQDVESPIGNSWFFGRDFITPPTMTLEVMAIGTGQARAAMNQLAGVWMQELEPGEDIELKYQADGETRIVYGRPRSFTPQPRKGTPDKLIDISLTFTLTEALYFESVEQSISIQLVPPSTGGFTVPFTAPIITASTGEIQGTISEVGGTAPTPFKVIIYGPITNAYVYGDGWKVATTGSLSAGQWMTIDTRKMSVIRNDGAMLGGWLTRQSDLQNVRLMPGDDRVILGGTDATGTAHATVLWRAAHIGL